MFTNVTAEVDGAIGRLTLNSPEKLNPLSWQRLDDIAKAARWFDEETDVRVVIVSGEGRAFSAGADLGTFSSRAAPGEPVVGTRDVAEYGRFMAEALETMRPTAIAAIRGWCVGGGLVLAAACDLRVAADDAMFSIPEVDLGIPLAWGGIPRLVREIGPALTKELVMTCRPFDATEAQQAGFLNRVVPADEVATVADELAAQIAGKSRQAIASTKRHVNAVTDQMVGTMRSWSDADALVTAFHDEEAGRLRRRYLEERNRSRS